MCCWVGRWNMQLRDRKGVQAKRILRARASTEALLTPRVNDGLNLTVTPESIFGYLRDTRDSLIRFCEESAFFLWRDRRVTVPRSPLQNRTTSRKCWTPSYHYLIYTPTSLTGLGPTFSKFWCPQDSFFIYVHVGCIATRQFAPYSRRQRAFLSHFYGTARIKC